MENTLLDLDKIKQHQKQLEQHPLLTDTHPIQTVEQLRTFMEHHVYCVWDFMCLVKGMQQKIAPSCVPWRPSEYTTNGAARLINDIVTEEESDYFEQWGYVSHFDLYIRAMEEIGANTEPVKRFIYILETEGLSAAIETAPVPSQRFMESTFGFIFSDKLHVMASAFAFGRETVIPGMYINMVNKLGITEQQAPKFYAWLNRHIQVDTDTHGPASIDLVAVSCNNNKAFYQEAQEAAHKSIQDKINFWDAVEQIIHG